MKYGLITFKETENIGDDIQSYVAIRFLPKIDYYIEREKLDLFTPKTKEKITTIMNGWFIHSKINFPPSPYIYPIYISTHFSAYNSGGIESQYLSGYAKKVLLKNAPIGCRDTGTMKLLEKNGIDNYFSGCLTLTIEKDKNIKKKKQICLVDIDERVEKQIIEKYGRSYKIIKKTHTLNKNENSNLSWKERFKNVKELLDIYQSSNFVVTSRLHCALPCLALETPVLLLYDEDKMYTKDRLSDYAKILHHTSTKKFLYNNGIDKLERLNNNPPDYKEIRKNIIQLVEEKIRSANESIKKISTELPEVIDYKKLYVTPKENIDSLYKEAVDNMEVNKRNYINLKYERDYWKQEWHTLLEESDPHRVSFYRQELDTMIEKYEYLSRENKILKEQNEKYKKKEKKNGKNKNNSI